MADLSRPVPRTLWLGLGLLAALLALGGVLPLLDTKPDHLHAPPVLGRVADFTLTNQDAQAASLADLSNRVWVADIIFTRCAGPCPRMTGQMKSLQNALPPASGVKLVTLTTDPDHDTPAVMKRYGDRFGADFNRWIFLTGSKREIAGLAGDSLKLSAVPVKPEDRKDDADLFIHTTIFVVVDRHARLRGIFETGGDGVDWTRTIQPRLLATLRELEGEP